MHGVTTHVVKGKRGLSCKSPIEHYLFAHLTTFSQHDGHVGSSNGAYTWIQEETLTHKVEKLKMRIWSEKTITNDVANG
jgi:hypothetical protein